MVPLGDFIAMPPSGSSAENAHTVFRAKGLVLPPPEAPWHRGNNGIVRKAGQ